MRTVLGIPRAFAVTFALAIASNAFAADDGTWSVKKSSGEVWVGSDGVQQASVKTDEVLKPGDTIRTGRNGRVLLIRGEESILIAPNSVIGLPAEKKEGLSTTITQQAGSILLEVEKKNVKHFEVETPYLAAVVKGTQFRVTVSASGATVDVVRGQVEVSDFRSGQIAQVMPGQHATAFSQGNAGLSLGGSGTLQPIQRGQPRASSVDRVPVPRNGLSAPDRPRSASVQQHRAAASPHHSATRISSALGEVRLDVHRVTRGLARDPASAGGTRTASRDNATVWSSGDSGSGTSSQGNSNSNSNGGNSGSAGSATSTAAANAGGNGNGLALGLGNGNGNGKGNNGNGIGNGGGNGNNGNGNGNNGNGNGNGNGRGRI
ncbi:MAG: FecR family protein [Bradyrhizobium sp.]